jgi:hypothetical protein
MGAVRVPIAILPGPGRRECAGRASWPEPCAGSADLGATAKRALGHKVVPWVLLVHEGRFAVEPAVYRLVHGQPIGVPPGQHPRPVSSIGRGS